MLGEERSAKKLVLSRFPADSGILADLSAGNLNVEFLERIFMKSKTDYKSAVFVRTSSVSDFWDAKAVDKQIDNQQIALSDYWIKDFLASDFRTTAAAGTRRLANALKTASKNSSSLVVKEQNRCGCQFGRWLQWPSHKHRGVLGPTAVVGRSEECNYSRIAQRALVHRQIQV